MPRVADGGDGMSVLRVLIEEVSADELRALAERLRPLLLAEQSAPAEDAWLRGAQQIAAYIGAPPSRVYALAAARRIPVHHDGSSLIARRSELDAWICSGGGKRP